MVWIEGTVELTWRIGCGDILRLLLGLAHDLEIEPGLMEAVILQLQAATQVAIRGEREALLVTDGVIMERRLQHLFMLAGRASTGSEADNHKDAEKSFQFVTFGGYLA